MAEPKLTAGDVYQRDLERKVERVIDRARKREERAGRK